MRNMKYVTIFAAIMLLAGILVLVVAATPAIALLGKLAIALAIIAFFAVATTYLMLESFASHVLHSDNFHWY